MRNINLAQRRDLTKLVEAWPGSYGAPNARMTKTYRELGIGEETIAALYRRCLVYRAKETDVVVPTDAGVRAIRQNLSA